MNCMPDQPIISSDETQSVYYEDRKRPHQKYQMLESIAEQGDKNTPNQWHGYKTQRTVGIAK